MKNWKLPVAAASPLQIASPVQPQAVESQSIHEHWKLEVGNVYFHLPWLEKGEKVDRGVVKVSIEDFEGLEQNETFLSPPLTADIDNFVDASFVFEVESSALSDEFNGGVKHHTVPHLRVELFNFEDECEDYYHDFELAFCVIALREQRDNKGAPSPVKTFRRMALKDHDGRDAGFFTFKLSTLERKESVSSSVDAHRFTTPPEGVNKTDIELIGTEISNIRSEIAQCHATFEARVKTLKSRLEDILNSRDYFPEDAKSYLSNFRRELVELEQDLSVETQKHHAEKAEQQTQEVLLLLEDAKSEIERLQQAAEKRREYLGTKKKNMNSLTHPFAISEESKIPGETATSSKSNKNESGNKIEHPHGISTALPASRDEMCRLLLRIEELETSEKKILKKRAIDGQEKEALQRELLRKESQIRDAIKGCESMKVQMEKAEIIYLAYEDERTTMIKRAEENSAALRKKNGELQTIEATQNDEWCELQRALRDLLRIITEQRASLGATKSSEEGYCGHVENVDSELKYANIRRALAQVAAVQGEVERLHCEFEKELYDIQLALQNMQIKYDESERNRRRLQEALALAEAVSGGKFGSTSFTKMAFRYSEGRHPLSEDGPYTVRKLLYLLAVALLMIVSFSAGCASVSGEGPSYINHLKHGYLIALNNLEQNFTSLVANMEHERVALQTQLVEKYRNASESTPFLVSQGTSLMEKLHTVTLETINQRSISEALFAEGEALRAQLSALEHQLESFEPTKAGPRKIIYAGQNMNYDSYLVNQCSPHERNCTRSYLHIHQDGTLVINSKFNLRRSISVFDEDVTWRSTNYLISPFRRIFQRKVNVRDPFELRLRRNGQLVVMNSETHRTAWLSTRRVLPQASYTAALSTSGVLVVKHPDGTVVWSSHLV